MTSNEVRQKYLDFFKKSPRNHTEIKPAPLTLDEDTTTLFTSSGMQPLVAYLMGEPHPSGSKRLVNSQPSIRAQGKNDDFFEVGDSRHLTYFEMLGNWSLGDYFKEEQLAWIWEFYTKDLRFTKERLHVSVFEGDAFVPKDTDAYNIWIKLGVSKNHIHTYGVKKNWWSRSGTPSEMPIGEIGGPDSEIFYEFECVKHDSKFGKICHPNCDCGRFLEIGNSVFIQYKKTEQGLEELSQRNVDFGGGLERITAVTGDNSDIFLTDIYKPTIEILEEITGKTYQENIRAMQIIADHLRASLALIASGIVPSNKLQGYVLRKLVRRVIIKAKQLKDNFCEDDLKLLTNKQPILDEYRKFESTLSKGLHEISKIQDVSGKKAFDLYQSYGFPLELTVEMFKEKNQKVDINEFKKEFEKHQEASRSFSAGVFKGGLADHSPEVVKLHSATHLLLAALRKVLGDHVVQKGQNITKERSRFDFPHSEKLSEEQLKNVENMINDVIERDLPVTSKVLQKDEALKTGAIHGFNEKYADTVKVYFVGSDFDGAFSKEFCGGPHVKRTSEIGRVRIKKQEKIGSGLMRVYLVLV